MRSLTRAAAGLAVLAGLGGCAGGRIYDNGINHVYLCAVRAVRSNGYQVRQQGFKRNSGKMIAARSVPDPNATPLKRGFFRRAAEVARNMWEHSKLEFWSEELAMARVRTDQRVVVEFKATGKGFNFLGLGARNRTRVKFTIDVTEYGREDWVIRRRRLPGAADEIQEDLKACLGPALIARRTAAEPVPGKRGKERKIPASEEKKAKSRSPPEKEAPPAPPAPPEELPPAIANVPPPQVPPRMTPEELEDVLKNGRRAYEAGNFAGTAELLQPAVQAYPGNSEALGYLGAAFYQLGRIREAIGMYERYLEVVPTDVRTRDFLKELKAKG